MVKVRDGQVVNRPIYVAVGVTVTGERDILGLWAGDGGEGAKYWLQVLTEIKNRLINRRRGRVHPGLRRTQRPAGLGVRGLAAGHRADLRHPPAAEHVSVRRSAGLG